MDIPRHLKAIYNQLDGRNENNTNPVTNQVFDAMLRATRSAMRTVEAKGRCDVLKSLRKERIGTTNVEHSVKKLCVYRDGQGFKVSVMNKVKDMVMREKNNDAYTEYRRLRKEDNKIWRECKKLITGPVRDRYVSSWRLFITSYSKSSEEKGQKKIDWLVSKWRSKDEDVPDVLEGVKIGSGDDGFPREFECNPRLYGGVNVSDAERAALMLPPKFGLFEDVSITNCRIQMEEALNKLRWNRIYGGERQEEHLYNEETRTIDINHLRVTSLPFNPGVNMPGALKEEEELQLHTFKNEVMAAVGKMKKKGREWMNLGEEEREGLASLKEKARVGEVVCCITDKSGRWSCDTRENYRDACMEELREEDRTPQISMVENDQGERELNSHAAALLRMMGLKEGGESEGERLRNAVQAKGTGLAPFYGLRKDHKMAVGGDEGKGPRMRPLCGAKECSTRRTSYLLCQLLTPLIHEGGTQCGATEELLSQFERVNRVRDADPRWVVGSLDVVSLYPSLDIEVCSIMVARALMDSDLVFKGVNWMEVALYLRYHMDQEMLETEGLAGFCPKRRFDRRAPIFECSGSNLDKNVRYEPWVFPDEAPDEEVVRRMFCIAVGVMVKRTMELHDFVIDGKMFRQKKGGSIGLDLTGVVSDIFMLGWDKRLMERMVRKDMITVVYGRYKDDVNFIADARGLEGDTAVGRERDERIMDQVKVLADGIHESIRVEADCGYNHEDRQGRLPILDVEVWIGETVDGALKILHSHYMKDVSSRMVMGQRSAHGDNTKRNVMVNEVGRILRNCSVYLPGDEVADKVSYYVRRMEYAGYDKGFRYNVVKMAIRKHQRRIKKWRKGETMYARDGGVRDGVDRHRRKNRWYAGDDGKYESVMFIQATKGSELKNVVQRLAKKNKVKLRVVERAGLTMKKVLQRSDPYEKKKCGRTDCVVCECGRPGLCRNRGCGYQLMCKEDWKKYKGQTGRSVYERVGEEVRDWRNRDVKSPLWRHSQEYHQGGVFELEVKVTDKSFGMPSRRMITESVMIEQLDENETMNSKQEWTYVKLNKVRVG